MINRILNLISGDYNAKELKTIEPIVDTINARYNDFDKLSDDQIKAKTDEFKQRYQEGESLDNLLPEAFAIVKQACSRMAGKKFDVKGEKRERNMIPYDVQLVGWICLHQGRIAEMKTGEGKTLVASLPVYLNALTGKWVHVVTVNDYLASRDADRMGALYERLGLSIWCVVKGVPVEKRRDEYSKDITYVENSELWFDYLRDNLVKTMEKRNLIRRPLHYAIVDEIDSILVDEARTPLIISEPDKAPTDKYEYYGKIVQSLSAATGKKPVSKWFLHELLNDEPGQKKSKKQKGNKKSNDIETEKNSSSDDEHRGGDYYIDEKTKTASLSSAGIKKLEQMIGVENLYKDIGYEEIHHIENALKAQAVFKRDKEYLVRDGQVVIVDEHTGRAMPGRRFSEWLHQAIEAKEKVQIQKESKTLATVTYQNFFKNFEKIAWMTGTAMTEAEEFEKIYELGVLQIPTNKPIIRVDKSDKVYFNQEAKRSFITDHITFAHEIGQPILIGTWSIHTSELVSWILKKNSIEHYVLNAKYHEQEANIVANAGKYKSIVVATNMAWRGTDIKLDPSLNEKLAKNYAKRAKKKIYATKDPTIISYVIYSRHEFELLSDSLINEFELTNEQYESSYNERFSSDSFSMRIKFNNKKKLPTDPLCEIIMKDPTKPDLELLQKNIHFGLFILGTEKHESRRIDNQLRGRAGRQGDAWVSQFFVAFDDLIMRKMGGEKIQSRAWLLMGKEDLKTMEFTQKVFTGSITRAQKQIEARHFGTRKHLFEYDSVIDKQRQRIYETRDTILQQLNDEQENNTKTEKSDVRDSLVVRDITSFVKPTITELFAQHKTLNTPIDDFVQTIQKEFAISLSTNELMKLHNENELEATIEQHIMEKIDQAIKHVPAQQISQVFTSIYLNVIDKYRIEHIDVMQQLRDKVGLMGYAQLDPLVMYKKEAYDKFESLLHNIQHNTLVSIAQAPFDQVATQPQQMIITPQNEEEAQRLMGMLKNVASNAPTPAKQTNKPASNFQWDKAVYQDEDGFEVFEVQEKSGNSENNSVVVIDTNTKKKLRPNDKVNIKYVDGTVKMWAKYKKVQEDIESGKAEIV